MSFMPKFNKKQLFSPSSKEHYNCRDKISQRKSKNSQLQMKV